MLPSKWKNLSRYYTKSIHFCKKLRLAFYSRHSKYSLWIYNVNIFSILGKVFADLFLCYFQRLQLLAVKNIEIVFPALYFYLHELKTCNSEFWNLIETGGINIFVILSEFFSGYGQLKSSFSDKENISGKIWDTP